MAKLDYFGLVFAYVAAAALTVVSGGAAGFFTFAAFKVGATAIGLTLLSGLFAKTPEDGERSGLLTSAVSPARYVYGNRNPPLQICAVMDRKNEAKDEFRGIVALISEGSINGLRGSINVDGNRVGLGSPTLEPDGGLRYRPTGHHLGKPLLENLDLIVYSRADGTQGSAIRDFSARRQFLGSAETAASKPSDLAGGDMPDPNDPFTTVSSSPAMPVGSAPSALTLAIERVLIDGDREPEDFWLNILWESVDPDLAGLQVSVVVLEQSSQTHWQDIAITPGTQTGVFRVYRETRPVGAAEADLHPTNNYQVQIRGYRLNAAGDRVYGAITVDSTQGTASDNPVDSTENTTWTERHKLNHLSYVFIRLRQPEDKNYWTSTPTIEIPVEGRKFTWPGQAVATYTRNAVAIVYDLLRQMGYKATEIHEPTARAEYTHANKVLALTPEEQTSLKLRGYGAYATGTHLRYGADITVTASDSMEEVFQQLKTVMGEGWIYEWQNKWFIETGRAKAAHATRITQGDIFDISYQPAHRLSERFNGVRFTLDQSDEHNYEETSIEYIDESARADRDDGLELTKHIGRLRALSDPVAAQRRASDILERGRKSAIVSATLRQRSDFRWLDWQPNDAIELEENVIAAYGPTNRFKGRLDSMTVNPDWTVSVVLLEEPTWSDSLILPPYKARQVVRQRDIPKKPTGLTLDEFVRVSGGDPNIYIEATVDDDGSGIPVRIRYKVTEYAGQTFPNARWRVQPLGDLVIDAVLLGATYEVQAQRAYPGGGLAGPRSDPVFDTVDGPLTIPAALAGVVVTGIVAGYAGQWTDPTYWDSGSTAAQKNAAIQSDLAFVEVFDSTTTSKSEPALSDLRRTVPRGTSAVNVSTITGTAARKVWFRQVNIFGNRGPFASGTASPLESAAGQDGVGFELQGAWSVSHGEYRADDDNHNVMDVVFRGGRTWVCILTHQASATTAPPGQHSVVTSNTWWELMANRGDPGPAGDSVRWRGAWVSGTSYAVNDLAGNDNRSWACTVAHVASSGNRPTGSNSGGANWDLLAGRGGTGPTGAAGIPGLDGSDGSDGLPGPGGTNSPEYVFAVYPDEALPASKRPANSWGFDVTGTVGGLTWHDGAPDTNVANPQLLRSQRQPPPGALTDGQAISDPWSVPAIVGRYGIDGIAGQDGEDGVVGADGIARERIFAVTATAALPEAAVGVAAPSSAFLYDQPDPPYTDGLIGVSESTPYAHRWVRPVTGSPVAGDVIGTAWVHDFTARMVGEVGPAANDGIGFEWRSAWATGQSYYAPAGSETRRSVVVYGGRAWTAKISHTSAAGNAPPAADSADESNTNWDLMANQGDAGLDGDSFAWKGDWVSGVAYKEQDTVASDGRSWICEVAHTSSTAPTGANSGTANWDLLADKGKPGPGFAPPATVTGTSVGTTFSYSWSAVEGATGYRIETTSVTAAGQFIRESDVDVGANSSSSGFIDAAAAAATLHVQIRTRQTISGIEYISAPSKLLKIAAGTVSSLNPPSLTATSGDSEIRVTWPAVTAALTYDMQYRAQGTSAWILWLGDSVSTRDRTITGLTNGQTYQIRALSAASGANLSDWSSTVTATPEAPAQVLSVPGNFDAMQSPAGTINLSWNASTGPVHRYRVQRSASSTFAGIPATIHNTSARTDTDTPGDGTWYYRVRAESNTAGVVDSGWSATETVTVDTSVPMTAPGDPRNVDATANGETAANVDWDAPTSWGTGSTGSRIYYWQLKLQGSPSNVQSGQTSSSQLSLTGLTAGTAYTVRVQADTDHGAPSSWVSDNFTTATATRSWGAWSASQIQTGIGFTSPNNIDSMSSGSIRQWNSTTTGLWVGHGSTGWAVRYTSGGADVIFGQNLGSGGNQMRVNGTWQSPLSTHLDGPSGNLDSASWRVAQGPFAVTGASNDPSDAPNVTAVSVSNEGGGEFIMRMYAAVGGVLRRWERLYS